MNSIAREASDPASVAVSFVEIRCFVIAGIHFCQPVDEAVLKTSLDSLVIYRKPGTVNAVGTVSRGREKIHIAVVIASQRWIVGII